jgi:hypothetical protein
MLSDQFATKKATHSDGLNKTKQQNTFPTKIGKKTFTELGIKIYTYIYEKIYLFLPKTLDFIGKSAKLFKGKYTPPIQVSQTFANDNSNHQQGENS